MKHSVDIFSSYQHGKIADAIEKLKSHMSSYITINIHSNDIEWDVKLNNYLCHNSIWNDKHLVILNITEKDIKHLEKPWFKKWLESNSPHHLIIGLQDCYAKHAIFQHKQIKNHKLYDKTGLTKEDLQLIGNDQEGIINLEKMKSFNHKQYVLWLELAANLSLEERLQSLCEYTYEEPLVFLNWIKTILKKNNYDDLANFKATEIMECFNMTCNWIRLGLKDEEKNIKLASGLMKWPDAKAAWQLWQRKQTRAQRLSWYLRWLEQESLLRGLDEHLSMSHGWQKCLHMTLELQRCLN